MARVDLYFLGEIFKNSIRSWKRCSLFKFESIQKSTLEVPANLKKKDSIGNSKGIKMYYTKFYMA